MKLERYELREELQGVLKKKPDGHTAWIQEFMSLADKTRPYVCITTITIIINMLAQIITTLTYIQEKPASNLAHKTEHRL
jgi:hypothetical protein